MKENASMNKKYILAITISLLLIVAIISQTNINNNPEIDFYSLDFLHNTKAVQKTLKDLGFFEANFTTADNYTINSIMLDQSDNQNIIATIVSFPGFVPGNKEGMTTLYDMLKNQPYNFMFIDSRGHGKSDGELLTIKGIRNYGQSQYLDMLAAIEYITIYNKKHKICPNIIIHGLCSGAYHTIKALHALKKADHSTYTKIKGVILDSAWSSIPDVIETVINAESIKRCKNYYVPFLQPYLKYIAQTFYTIYFKKAHTEQKPISAIISEVDQPVFFIHAQDDQFVPINQVYPLLEKTKYPTFWPVANSSHVNSHLDHKDEYATKMDHFIKSII